MDNHKNLTKGSAKDPVCISIWASVCSVWNNAVDNSVWRSVRGLVTDNPVVFVKDHSKGAVKNFSDSQFERVYG